MSNNINPSYVTGIFAIVGVSIGGIVALVGHGITAWFSLRSKKMELLFARKADSYQRLLELAAIFATDPHNQEKYLPFVGALDAATIVASAKVADLLINPQAGSLSVSAQYLRAAETLEEVRKAQLTKWYDSMKRVADAIREVMAGITR
jgi:hypothetical protein